MSTHPPERWARIDALFGAALDRPVSERLDFLAAECGEDRELYDAVRSLLEDEAAAGALIGESVTGFAPDLLAALPPDGDEDDDPVAGRVVGPYRLVAELGRGGMGAVYLAERADGEFEKRVALKLVKRGMDTDEILRRFRFERRILAGLEHPNIARLYDGGASEDGRPYLVMELVEGEKITDYCDHRRLDIDERLGLFRDVCAAVQHAHQNLVVHRDIKPSNILVRGDGTPKLLDFGIAKLVDDDDTDDSPRTRTGMRILTPEYAAPEQRRGEPVTTASDVFALGAVLHELITGRRPATAARHGPTGGESAGSARAGGTGGPGASGDPAELGAATTGATATAAARGTTPHRLRRLLRGDLGTIVEKALEADPRLRYQSAQQLLDDLDRYRQGRPVLARPPALGYRARKFARRHRVALATSGVVLLSLLGGLGAALWQAERAATERDRAERQRLIAEDERDAAEQVAGFIEGMFAAANPFSAQPGRMDTLRIGAFLDRGAERINEELRDRPLVRARMLGVLGRVYRSLGRYDRAEPLLEEALATYRAVHGEAHVDVADALNALGNLYLGLERAEDAERVHRQALTLRREIQGPDHPDVGASLNNLAAALQNLGRLDEAEPLYDQLLELHRRMDPPDSASFADALNTRMVLAFRKDDMATALPLARQILDIHRGLFDGANPHLAQSMNNLAQVLSRTGAVEEAEPLLRESLAVNRQIFAGDHPNIAAGAVNLAGTLLRLEREDEAEPLYLEAIAMNRRLLGDGHPALAVALSNYADLLARRGSQAEAEAAYREALAINRAALGPGHTSVGIVSTRLGAMLCAAGRAEEGRALHQEGRSVLQSTLPPGHSRLEELEGDACAG
jgi:eukaryotic-like serine/threonine-protein kinase